MRCPIQTKLNNLIGFSLFLHFQHPLPWLHSFVLIQMGQSASQSSETKLNEMIFTQTHIRCDRTWVIVCAIRVLDPERRHDSFSEWNELETWAEAKRFIFRSQLLSDWTDEDHIHKTHAASTVHMRIEGQAMRTHWNIVWWWSMVWRACQHIDYGGTENRQKDLQANVANWAQLDYQHEKKVFNDEWV